MPPDSSIKIGVSACLLGHEVRWDGGTKRDRFLEGTLARFVEFQTLCPEVDAGLPVPREPMRLVRGDGQIRLAGTKTGDDRTDALERWSRDRVEQQDVNDLSGVILKSKSPSCGLERVKVYDHNGVPSKVGIGLFARALTERHPWLPVEEEGRLHDLNLRENFLERVFAYRRLRGLFDSDWSLHDVVTFHTREKLLLMAHEPEAYRELGRLVATMKTRDTEDLESTYCTRFMNALGKHASRGRHVNVLQHMAGYFSDLITADDRAELVNAITDFGAGRVPLLAPLTLLKHWVRVHDQSYLAAQTYIQPHPAELMLRNHV